MGKKIAKIISYVLHPSFIPFYVTLLLLFTDPLISFLIPAKGKWVLSGIIFLTTIILPFSSGYLFYRVKLVSSLFPENREERIYLLLNAAIFYFLSYYLVRGHQVLLDLSYFLLGSTIIVICALIINFFYRISLHMTAAGGLAGGALWMSFMNPEEMTPVLLAVILLAGVVGTARLVVKPEKSAEVWYGLMTGTTVMFFLFALA